ncbi:MAG: hypothetical protein AB7F43_12680 [Bacteriovoracia bacterium]
MFFRTLAFGLGFLFISTSFSFASEHDGYKNQSNYQVETWKRIEKYGLAGATLLAAGLTILPQHELLGATIIAAKSFGCLTVINTCNLLLSKLINPEPEDLWPEK